MPAWTSASCDVCKAATFLPGQSRPDTSVESGKESRAARRQPLSRIGVSVDGHPESRDAVVLGAALAGITGAELMLVAVATHPGIALCGNRTAACGARGAPGARCQNRRRI